MSYCDQLITTEHFLKLHRDDRVLEITSDGYLRMILSDGSNGSIFKLIQISDLGNQCIDYSLYYKDNRISFDSDNNDVKINDSGTKYPYITITSKPLVNTHHMAILNNRFASLVLDNHNGKNPGPIKWSLLDIGKYGKVTFKDNQWFLIAYNN